MLLIVHFCGSKDENGHSALQERGVISVGVSISVAMGFIALMLLLGYGLISIPKFMWKFSNLQTALDRTLFDLSGILEKLKVTTQRLVTLVKVFKENVEVAYDDQIYYEFLKKDIDEFLEEMTEKYDFKQ